MSLFSVSSLLQCISFRAQRLSCENNKLFYIGFVLLYIKTIISETSVFVLPDSIDALLLIGSATFFFLHCVQYYRAHPDKVHTKVIYAVVVVLVFLAGNYMLTGNTSQLMAFIFIVSVSFGVEKRGFVSFWFKVSACLFIGMVFIYAVLYMMGNPLATSVVRMEDENRIRFSFFFNHPNGAANMAMLLVGAWLYLNLDKGLKAMHYVIALLVALFVLCTTDSRTSALLAAMLVPLFLIYQNTSLFDCKPVRVAIAILPLVFFAVTYLLAGPLYSLEMGALFTGRVWLWHTTLTNLGITVFGREFVPTTGLSFYGNWDAAAPTLDSFYAFGLFTMGILASGLFCSTSGRYFIPVGFLGNRLEV